MGSATGPRRGVAALVATVALAASAAVLPGVGRAAGASGAAVGLAPGWSAPVVFEGLGVVDEVSCGSPTLCVATDTAGMVVTWNGRTWSAPRAEGATASPGIGNFGLVSCPTATFCMLQAGTTSFRTYDGRTWSPLLHGPTPTLVNAWLSCASATFCLFTGEAGTAVWNGRAWGTQDAAEVTPGGIVSEIACPTPSRCVAVSTSGLASTWQGSGWVDPTQIGTPPTSTTNPVVACASATWCAAIVPAGTAAVWNGSSWVPDPSLDLQGAASLSCPAASSCVASFEDADQVVTWNGTAWSAPVAVVEPTLFLTDLSCPTTTFCVASDNAGAVMEGGPPAPTATPTPTPHSPATTLPAPALHAMAHGRWGRPARVFSLRSNDQVIGVSCAGASFCMGVFDAPSCEPTGHTPPSTPTTPGVIEHHFCTPGTGPASFATFDGRSWSTQAAVPNSASGQGIDCWASHRCVVLTDDGLTRLGPGGWTSQTLRFPETSNVASISCPGTSFCVAVDDAGDAAVYRHRAWSKPAPVDLRGSFEAVSCASPSFCVAVDSTGHALAWNGHAWSAPLTVEPEGTLTAVACPAVGWCAALDARGRVAFLAGSHWSTPAWPRHGVELATLACPAAGACLGIDHSGEVLTLARTSWSKPADVDRAGHLVSVSCASTRRCVALDASGHAVVYSAT